MSALAAGAVFLLGLIVGSFLNAVIHRLPRGIGLGHPRRSFCPQCGRSLPWSENIPVLSWLLLRGRCAGCGGEISARYPLVETITAVLFLWVWFSFPPAPAAVAMVLVCLLIAATFIDLEHMILPDSLTLGGAVAGVILSVAVAGWLPGADWEERLRASLFGALAGFAALFLVVELGKIVFGRKRIPFSPQVDFRIQCDAEGPRLRVGDEEWPLGEFFYRPNDSLDLELADGSTWKLRENGVEKDSVLTHYHDASGWSGTLQAAVIPREAMGFGDVKFMLTLGAFLGWPGALFSIGAGSVIGAVAGLVLLAARRLDDSGRIPFGPYLAAGALLWVLAGPAVLRVFAF